MIQLIGQQLMLIIILGKGHFGPVVPFFNPTAHLTKLESLCIWSETRSEILCPRSASGALWHVLD